MPAGVPLAAADVNGELARRQAGYGRGRRMQIERDEIEWLSGVRAGQTLGSPIAMLIRNRDWTQWQEIMDPAVRPDDGSSLRKRAVTRPRPGHADLTGVLKYDREDARDILERASARETTARVAAAAVCRRLLSEFGVAIGSHLVHLGGVDVEVPTCLPDDLNAAADESPLRTLDRAHRCRQSRGQHTRWYLRSRDSWSPGRPRLACLLGPQTRRPTGRRDHVDSRGEGSRNRHRLRSGPPHGC